VSLINVGDVQVAQGDLAGALKSFGDSLAIAERLAQSEPDKSDWQRDQSIQHSRIGRVQMRRAILSAHSNPSATASPLSTVWRNPILATAIGSAISR
jgi:hypothetical protein